MPKPLSEFSPAPLFHLYGRGTSSSNIHWVDVSLPKSSDGILREVYTTPDAVVSLLTPGFGQKQICSNEPEKNCLRIRFSHPILEFNSTEKPIIPLSDLASCDNKWQQWQKQVSGKIIFLQLTELKEMVDSHITASTIHSPDYPLTSGSLWLLDGIESALHQDNFISPPLLHSLLLIFFFTLLSSFFFAFIRIHISIPALIIIPLSVTAIISSVSENILWPITALAVAIIAPMLFIMLIRIAMGERRARIVTRLIPPQVRSWLLSQGGGYSVNARKVFATVLISDLQGFTDITSVLNDPKQILQLMNSYLGEVTTGLQEKHDAWLEAYVADMVCYYWPQVKDKSSIETLRSNAVGAMTDLYQNQQYFFSRIKFFMHGQTSQEQLAIIRKKIDAGIALTEGHVIMGELGPAKGIRKFGVLGDPLNLASRIEGLSRFFNARMLITVEFVETCRQLGLPVRRLVNVQVKGRTEPVMIYAVSLADNPDYSQTYIKQWQHWLNEFEQKDNIPEENSEIPRKVWQQDIATYTQWHKDGYWDNKRNCFTLSFK
jgi:adenylate cyclase